ncbi:hypothetical protein Ancab_028280 [Ancistrocladus abbreviatus]
MYQQVASLYLFLHQHPLILSDEAYHMFTCNSCGQVGQGVRYQCIACAFDMHRECPALTSRLPDIQGIKFPDYLYHKLHPPHPLLLTDSSSASHPKFCAACNQACNLLWYCCSACDVNFHFQCLAMASRPASTLQGSGVQDRGVVSDAAIQEFTKLLVDQLFQAAVAGGCSII